MANILYSNARQLFLTAKLDWVGDPSYKVMLINTQNYQPKADDDKVLADIPANARVTVGMPLVSRAGVAGAADADDVTFAGVSGSNVGALVIYRDNGSDSASELIAFIDTATGLPITPNGGDIIVVWDNGVNKIFRL